jgi:uncharacterized protein (DUF1330 family)
MKHQTPESAVSRQIADWLVAHGIYARRNNVGVAKFGNRFVAYGEKGEPDRTAFFPVKGKKNQFHIVHIEVKADKGAQRYEQKIWQQCAEKRGEFYVLARSFEDVESFLKEKGIR